MLSPEQEQRYQQTIAEMERIAQEASQEIINCTLLLETTTEADNEDQPAGCLTVTYPRELLSTLLRALEGYRDFNYNRHRIRTNAAADLRATHRNLQTFGRNSHPAKR